MLPNSGTTDQFQKHVPEPVPARFQAFKIIGTCEHDFYYSRLIFAWVLVLSLPRAMSRALLLYNCRFIIDLGMWLVVQLENIAL